MHVYDTQTCGVQEITDLWALGTPSANAKAFCELCLYAKTTPTADYWTTHRHSPVLKKETLELFCFYLFTGREDSMAQEFADFIREEGLGEVTGPAPKLNAAYHTDHKNVAFLWSPDANALDRWYKKNFLPKE